MFGILNQDVMVNNGNLVKAVLANLPFWGVRYSCVPHYMPLLINSLDSTSDSRYRTGYLRHA